MTKLLNVSTSPHVRGKDSTQTIMGDVIIALIPASLFGVYNFGLYALLVILTCILASVATEYSYQRWMKKKNTISDLSAIVTGLFLALNLPPTAPLWMAILGSVFAILLVKQLYGGLGQNFMNPALAARCFLLISFSGRMTSFVTPDGVSGATPLAILKTGESVDVIKMFIGTISGTIGETSVIAILIGAAYLLYKKVISIRIPATYIITFSLFIVFFGTYTSGNAINYLAAHLCGGGLMFGAFFMATDYVTSPITKKGQLVFAFLLGIMTGLFRIFGPSAEGVSYAIIIGNLLVPLIEKVTLPVAFGKEGK